MAAGIETRQAACKHVRHQKTTYSSGRGIDHALHACHLIDGYQKQQDTGDEQAQ